MKVAIREENYPVISEYPLNRKHKEVQEKLETYPLEKLLKSAIKRKIDSDLSYYYKKNLNAVYRNFTSFLTPLELKEDISFLAKLGSDNYRMTLNKKSSSFQNCF